MISVSVHEEYPSLLPKKRVVRLARIAARYEPKLKGEVVIHVVSSQTIKRLNARHRGINKVTDVLSFAWQEGEAFPSGSMLGELYISPQKIVRQAKAFNVSAVEEYSRMLIHGLLHIVGYDHIVKKDAKKMFALQEKIVKKFLSKRK